MFNLSSEKDFLENIGLSVINKCKNDEEIDLNKEVIMIHKLNAFLSSNPIKMTNNEKKEFFNIITNISPFYYSIYGKKISTFFLKMHNGIINYNLQASNRYVYSKLKTFPSFYSLPKSLWLPTIYDN